MFSRDISKLVSRVKNDRHHHSVQFYNDDPCLLEDLSRYVGGALGRGDSAIVIATQAHREGLKKILHLRGFDTSHPRLSRRYLEFDAAETLSKFMVDGLPDAAAFSEIVSHVLVRARVAAEGEHPRVVAFGEMVALLWAEGNAAGAISLERFWNDLAHTNSFSLHCAYPKSAFKQGHEDLFQKICVEHSHVVSAHGECRLATEFLQ
jgi:MEDS: MEthanogen/methylotroph, DcmR Sensory domain